MSEVKSKYDLDAAKSMFMDFKPLKEISKTLLKNNGGIKKSPQFNRRNESTH